MDELAATLGEPVVIQIGTGSYVPKNAGWFRFAESLDSHYDTASVVVAHGGLGTIVETLERGKKLVCVVNPITLDQHQEHLLRVFTERNYLLWCRSLDGLGQAIEQAKSRQFARYQRAESHIHETIKSYLARIS